MSPTLAEGAVALLAFVGVVVLGVAFAPYIARFWQSLFHQASNIADRVQQEGQPRQDGKQDDKQERG